MSDSELELSNIETVLIESNSMSDLERSLEEIYDLAPMTDELKELIRVTLYFNYYKGRLDSSIYLISNLKKYVDSRPEITESELDLFLHITKISDDQFE